MHYLINTLTIVVLTNQSLNIVFNDNLLFEKLVFEHVEKMTQYTILLFPN